MKRPTSGMDRTGQIAALLRDFAAIQKSKQSMWGHKRAAAAILALEEPIESLLEPSGTLQKIPNIHRTRDRGSGQASDVERRRRLRDHVLSRAQVLAALRNPKLKGPRVEDYLGDLQMHSTWSDGSQTLEDIIDSGSLKTCTASARRSSDRPGGPPRCGHRR